MLLCAVDCSGWYALLMPRAEKPKPTRTAEEVARFWKALCKYCSSFHCKESMETRSSRSKAALSA